MRRAGSCSCVFSFVFFFSTGSKAGPMYKTPGRRTAAGEAVRTQCVGCERLAGATSSLQCSAGLSCASWCSMSPTATATIEHFSHLGTQEQRCCCMLEKVVGGFAGRERPSCTLGRRTAMTDRLPTGGMAGRSTVAGAVGCDRRTRVRVYASFRMLCAFFFQYV